MKDYILFIDTEASGLPKNWKAPYSKKNNWPTAVQISWVVFKKDGSEVKQENFYVYDEEIKIKKSAFKVHGITKAFLAEKGISRKEILVQLSNDINSFDPLLVAHFMELDYHILSADYYKSGLPNPFINATTFCTMMASKAFIKSVDKSFLRLNDLYKLLFNDTLHNQHNALVDARATAECFFELLKQGTIDNDIIINQKPLKNIHLKENAGCGFILTLLVLMTFTILLMI